MALYEDRSDMGLRRASDALPDAHQKICADRDATLAFLKKQGFADTEIERQPTKTLDKLARDFAQQPNERFRYVVTTALVATRFAADSGATSTPLRKIRVVSTFEFELK